MKKLVCVCIFVALIISCFAGCGKKKSAETNPDGSYVQGKVCTVAYNASGYGDTWLRKAKEKFEEIYSEEGYKIELKISHTYEYKAAMQIGLGPDKNDVDLYMNGEGLEKVLDASKKTMRDGSAVLVDLTDVVWNQPAIGADKKEESKTIAQRYLLDKEYLYYDGVIEEYHNGIYALPIAIGSCGIVLNPAVTSQYGYGSDNLPRTTDEFNAMCAVIAESSETSGIYAYSWAGANASGYMGYLFYEYFAQYSGKEAFMNFVKTYPESGDVLQDGWMVYEDPGILQGLKALEPIMKMEYSTKGSAGMDHMKAQHEMLTGNAAFIMNGDWVLNEMEEEYYDQASQCIMLNTPVLSVIGTECGISDGELSQAVKMIDDGQSNAQIISQIPGLNEEETQRIRDARNIYSCGDKSVRGGACIPAYADGKDVAILFLRFLCSEDGCQIIRDEAYNVAAFSCESYASRGNTPFMESVIANINPGQGQYISMDAGLSIVRANSGMLPFNHPSIVSPQTFRAMILDESGILTADYMYHTELEYVKTQWQQWAAYVK